MLFQEREKTFGVFEHIDLPNLLRDETLTMLQDRWLSGKITNFEYLMQLNNHSGRTYNDLMQYPVFPFVLKDYQSPVLDLNDEQSFRYIIFDMCRNVFEITFNIRVPKISAYTWWNCQATHNRLQI